MYQPKTGAKCSCKPGIQRDNCPQCEGTGMRIDFRAIRERNQKSVTRYVATYVKDGQRTLMSAAQGRNTYATPEEAAEWIAAVTANNSADTVRQVWGDNPRFEVRPCPCWPNHFDPQTIYFD